MVLVRAAVTPQLSCKSSLNLYCQDLNQACHRLNKLCVNSLAFDNHPWAKWGDPKHLGTCMHSNYSSYDDDTDDGYKSTVIGPYNWALQGSISKYGSTHELDCSYCTEEFMAENFRNLTQHQYDARVYRFTCPPFPTMPYNQLTWWGFKWRMHWPCEISWMITLEFAAGIGILAALLLPAIYFSLCYTDAEQSYFPASFSNKIYEFKYGEEIEIVYPDVFTPFRRCLMGLLLWPTLIGLSMLINSNATSSVLKDCEGSDGTSKFTSLLTQAIVFNFWEFLLCFIMWITMVVEFYYWPLVKCQYFLGFSILTYGLCCSKSYTITPEDSGCLIICMGKGFLYRWYKWIYKWSSKTMFDLIFLIPGVEQLKNKFIQSIVGIIGGGNSNGSQKNSELSSTISHENPLRKEDGTAV